MIKKFLNDALKDPSVVKKLKEQGYNPKDIKSKKTFLAIINNSEKFDVQQMSIVTKKRKGGPREPHISKLDLILKRLDNVDAFIVEQRKFNTRQEEFNQKVLKAFKDHNWKI